MRRTAASCVDCECSWLSNNSLKIEPRMLALPPPPPLLLTLVPCAMLAMAAIGTTHADSATKLRYPQQMKVMMQAADGGGSESGDSQSRATTVVTFVVDVSAAYQGMGAPTSKKQ